MPFSVTCMIRKSDLNTFAQLVESAEQQKTPSPPDSPNVTLRADGNSDDSVRLAELFRLGNSLKIASVAGDIPKSVFPIFDDIVCDLSSEEARYLSLTYTTQWVGAIRWAMTRPPPAVIHRMPLDKQEREFHVGNACRRLRTHGYRINIDAFGSSLGEDTRCEIARYIDSLIAQIGGVNTITQLFQIMQNGGKIHNGIWLFGNVPSTGNRISAPAIPFGWLLSIALRNIHESPRGIFPNAQWELAMELATDFATSLNCQRYNQFDGFSANAPDFPYIVKESFLWRELFTSPQVPSSVIPILRDALSKIDWPKGMDYLANEVDQLFVEITNLLDCLNASGATFFSNGEVHSSFPLLREIAYAAPGAVNSKFLDPFGPHPREQDRFLFFETNNGNVMTLPTTLSVAAGCEVIFRLLWCRAGQKASKVVGDTIEKSIAIACRKHTADVQEKLRYSVGKEGFEIDVAVRNHHEIILFESKAKSLTSEARAGDIMKIFQDYTKSYLFMLRQLVRHEVNIRRGSTPLTKPRDDTSVLVIRKVAVSPLSYGPVSDHLLINTLMCAITNARLMPVDQNSEHAKILNNFNTTLEKTIEDIDQIARLQNGEFKMFAYSMNISWLDLGQLLYCLDRGCSISDGLSVLRHITFSTRDFWTEAAFADISGLSDRKWRSV